MEFVYSILIRKYLVFSKVNVVFFLAVLKIEK